jgi:dihydroflavonol-4-reductase
MSAQILITGATGFIGRQLTRDLVERGKSVRVLARSPRKARELFGEAVEVCGGDVTNAAALEAACRGIETIYHIAGSYRFGLRQRRELWRTNVDGAENVLSSAWSARVEKVVHLSSGGVLQRRDDTRLIDETDFPERARRFCPYKASKWHSEQRALAWAKRGLPVSIASTTCPIGRGDETPTPTGRMIRDFLRREFPFYCRTGLNFISIADLSEGLQRVAEAGRPGERYLVSDENLWLRDFLELLAMETGLAAPRMRLPGPVVRIIGCGGEVFDLLVRRGASARVCVETTLQARYTQFFSNAKARTELGWKPRTTIQESISEAVAWFRGEAQVELATASSPVE